MNAKFEKGELTLPSGQKQAVEFVTLSGGFMGKDEVRRVATDSDKVEFEEEYKAFKNPPPPPEDKDATIAALKAELAKAKDGK